MPETAFAAVAGVSGGGSAEDADLTLLSRANGSLERPGSDGDVLHLTGDTSGASGVSRTDNDASSDTETPSSTASPRVGWWSTGDEKATPRQLAVVLRFPILTQRLWWRVVSWLRSQRLLSDEEQRICAFLNQGRQTIDAHTGWIVAVDRGTGEIDGGMGLAARYANVHALCEATFWEDLKRVRRKGLVECVVRPAGGRIPRKARYALCLHARLLQDLPRGVVVPPDLAEALGLHLAPRPQDLPDPTEGSGPGPGTMMRRDPEAAAVRFAGDPVVVSVTPDQAKKLASVPRWKHDALPPPAKASASGLFTGQALRSRCFLARPKTSPYYAKTSSPFGLLTQVPGQARYQDTPWKSTKAGASAAARRAEHELTAAELRAADATLSRAWHIWRADLGAGRVNFSRRFFDEAGRGILTPTYRDLRRAVGLARRRMSAQHVLEELTRSVEAARDLVPFVSARLWRIVHTLPPVRDGAAAQRRRTRVGDPGTTVGQAVAQWAESSDRGRAYVAGQAGLAASRSAPADNPLGPAYAEHRPGLFEIERAAAMAAAGLASTPTMAKPGPKGPVVDRSPATIEQRDQVARARRDQERGRVPLADRLARILAEKEGRAQCVRSGLLRQCCPACVAR